MTVNTQRAWVSIFVFRFKTVFRNHAHFKFNVLILNAHFRSSTNSFSLHKNCAGVAVQKPIPEAGASAVYQESSNADQQLEDRKIQDSELQSMEKTYYHNC